MMPFYRSAVWTLVGSFLILRTGGRQRDCAVETDSGHLANGSLQNGVEAALRRVAVARYHLLLHLHVEAIHLVGEWEDVAKAEGGDTVGEGFVSEHT